MPQGPKKNDPTESAERLISLWLDGAADADQLARLQRMLRENDDAVRTLAAYSSIEVGLVNKGKSEGRCIEVLADIVGEQAEDLQVVGGAGDRRVAPTRRARRFASPVVRLSVAATVLIAAVASWALREHRGEADSVVSTKGPIGRIVESSAGSRWMFDRGGVGVDIDPEASKVIAGDSTLRLVEGELKLLLNNGVEVSLFGPSLLEIESEMQARMLSGRMRAKVTEDAEGFRVDVPQATVVDLGTEFGIEVDSSGSSDVVVFNGSVNVDLESPEGVPVTRRELASGEALRLDEHKRAVRLASIWSDRFEASSGDAATAARPPVILSVEDNLDRVWNYYEIVHSGMGEDAKAMVSDAREHEWNGLTRLGMPDYLLGGDYVRMFKGDQILMDLELKVLLAVPSRLFILFDERVPAPAWLESGFRRTGDRLGLDMGPWDGPTGDEYAYGKGPGRSIDRVVVVWESKEPVRGVVNLGSTESLALGTLMYGIVAQPVETDSEKVALSGF